MYLYIYIYIYGIHYWRIIRSSCRKLAWRGFEPTTTEFHFRRSILKKKLVHDSQCSTSTKQGAYYIYTVKSWRQSNVPILITTMALWQHSGYGWPVAFSYIHENEIWHLSAMKHSIIEFAHEILCCYIHF